MSYISDSHKDWHFENGKWASCPWDCGANEPFASQCPECGEFSFEYPSDPNNPEVGCSDPAACAAAIPDPSPVLVPASPVDDPWAFDPPF